jgi:hypothetical protein
MVWRSHRFPLSRQNEFEQFSFFPPFPFISIYLGGSNLIASNSDIDFFLKHGAKSSSSKSPWQPVSAATFFFTESGSRWSAHGESAEPLINIARWIRSGSRRGLEIVKQIENDQMWIDEKLRTSFQN